jgi:indolepyruvate ferredoxin oxidoreductase
LFGYAHVRRLERALLAHYTKLVVDLAADLEPGGYERAARIAALPDIVRGYEEVKVANVASYLQMLVDEGVDVSALKERL